MNGLKVKARKPSAYFYRTFEDHPFPVIVIDITSQLIVWVNKAAIRFYSFNKAHKKKLHLNQSEFFLTDPLLQEFIYDNNPGPFITVQKMRDGKEHYVEIYKEFYRSPDDKPLCCLISYDNTEKKLLEQELGRYKAELSSLRQKNERPSGRRLKKTLGAAAYNESTGKDCSCEQSLFRTTIDTVANPVFIRNENRVIINCNSAFEEYFATGERSAAGKTISEIFPGDFAGWLGRLDEQIIRDGVVKTEETIIEKAAGERRNVVVTENLLKNNDRGPAALVSVLIDITGFRKMEKELKESRDKEKNLTDIKSRLLSTSSHEFRTPLTTILIASEVLAMVGRTWSEQRYLEQIIKIQNAVTYMTGLLDDILTVDRTDRDVWKFNPAMVNLHDLCRKMIEEVSDQASEAHKFSFHYFPGSKHAIVDEKLLQHIITNLLSNAVKYSPQGGEICFKVTQSLSNLEFIISDQGIGIPEEDKNSLFETFYRCKNSAKIKGTGLGLAIVKRSVEAHGGQIKFESKLNEGATFRVLIPLMTSI